MIVIAKNIAPNEMDRRHTHGCKPGELRVGILRVGCLPQIALALRVARIRPHELLPAAIETGADMIDLVVGTGTILRIPEVTTHRVKVETKRVAHTVGVDLLHAAT